MPNAASKGERLRESSSTKCYDFSLPC